jgi:ankyrin repeat protein
MVQGRDVLLLCDECWNGFAIKVNNKYENAPQIIVQPKFLILIILIHRTLQFNQHIFCFHRRHSFETMKTTKAQDQMSELLHIADSRALSDSEWRQIFRLLDACNDVTLSKFSFHYCELSLLHLACWQWGDRRWFQLARRVIQIDPTTVSQTDEYGSLPLHYCLRSRHPSMDLVKLLINADPSTVYKEDKAGRLALHIACDNLHAPTEVIRTLLHANPKAVSYGDRNGRIPLHIACKNTNLSQHFAPLLLEVDPSTVWVQDCIGQIPLHVACARSAPNTQTIQTLLRIDPISASLNDDMGQTPLHVACSNKSLPIQCIQLLVMADRHAVSIPDECGDLPIHIACQMCPSEERANLIPVLRLLLKHNFGSVQRPNFRGKVPAQLLPGEGGTEFMDRVALLVQQDMNIEKQIQWLGDVYGKLPVSMGSAILDPLSDWIDTQLKQLVESKQSVEDQLQASAAS